MSDTNSNRARRHRIVGVLVFVLIGAMLLALLVPIALREFIEWQVSKRADLEVSLADVDLDPIAGSITFHGVEVRARTEAPRAPGRTQQAEPSAVDSASEPPQPTPAGDAAPCWLCIEQVVIDFAWSSLASDAVRLDSVLVVEPRLRLVRQREGDLELPDLLDPEPEDGTEPETRAADMPGTQTRDADRAPRLIVDRLTVEGGALSFLDMTIQPRSPLTFEVDEIDLHNFAMGRAADSDSPTRLELDASIAGAPVTLEAQWRAGRDGLLANARFDATGIHLSKARAYLSDHGLHGVEGTLDLAIGLDSNRTARDSASVAIGLRDGALDWRRRETAGSAEDVEVNLEISAAEIDLDTRLGTREIEALVDPDSRKARVAGELVIKDFDAVDSEPPRFAASWSELSVELGETRVEAPGSDESSTETTNASARYQVTLESFEWRSPTLRLSYSEDGPVLPWQARPEAKKSQGVEVDEGQWRIELERLRVSNGRFELKDRRTEPFVRVDLSGIEMEADAIDWPPGRAETVHLESSSREGEKLVIDASGSPNDLTASVNATHIRLEPFNPYLDRYAGYWAREGQLSLDSQVSAGEDDVEIASQLTLHALELEATDADHDLRDSIGVPLEIALALMKDSDDEIDLDLTFHVSPDGGFAVDWIPALRKALAQSVVNAISTPLRLLSSLDREAKAITEFDPVVISFRSGEVRLEAESEKELDEIADVMVERPKLALSLQGQSTPDERLVASRAPTARASPDVEAIAPTSESATGTALESAQTSPEKLALARIDRVCQFFREVRGLSARRFLVQTQTRVESGIEPGVEIALDVVPPESEEESDRRDCSAS